MTKQTKFDRLYARRYVNNVGDIHTWAIANGFPKHKLEDRMHVTVCFSRQPVDIVGLSFVWHYTVWANPFGLQKFGRKPALTFNSGVIEREHRVFRSRGADYDFETFTPHVSFATSCTDNDLLTMLPFTGEIRFGEYVFTDLPRKY